MRVCQQVHPPTGRIIEIYGNMVPYISYAQDDRVSA
jgi:hypothetical protein